MKNAAECDIQRKRYELYMKSALWEMPQNVIFKGNDLNCM